MVIKILLNPYLNKGIKYEKLNSIRAYTKSINHLVIVIINDLKIELTLKLTLKLIDLNQQVRQKSFTLNEQNEARKTDMIFQFDEKNIY